MTGWPADAMPEGVTAAGLAGLAGLAAELCDLKRIRDARGPDSVATRLFRRAWAALAAGEDAEEIALGTTADALAACRLGGIDQEVMTRAHMDGAAAMEVLRRSFNEVSGPVEPTLRAKLRDMLGQGTEYGDAPTFAEALIRQPRAGATCPGKPRIVLEPPEMHGDHCLTVAVLAVCAAPRFGAEPVPAFLAGLAHHLHNATLPDSGFAGEMLLGEHLQPLMDLLFRQELATVPPALAEEVRAALDEIVDASTPVGQAFHMADVMDRVLEMRHFDRVAQFRVEQALEDMDLVHAGPTQAFHQAVLREAGLP